MRQAIHIFRKDARHCWPYIAAILGITVLHAWRESLFTPDPRNNTDPEGLLLELLLIVAWWLAIGQAVHGESLVGDRQFWTTRPCSWKSVLIAKLAFVAAFIGLPILISDCAILLASGFNPLHLVSGLLWRQCWLAAFLVLPLLLAVLTRATRDFLLAALATYAGFGAGIAVFLGYLAPRYGLEFRGNPGILDLVPWCAAAAGLLLAVWQFSRRRTAVARAFAIAVATLAVIAIAPSLLPVRPVEPARLDDNPAYRNIRVELSAEPETPAPFWSFQRGQMKVDAKIVGWPSDLIDCQLVSVAATAPGTKTSTWAPTPLSRLRTPAVRDGRVSFSLQVPYELWKSPKTLDLNVSLALWLYESHHITVPIRRGWAHVSAFGNTEVVGGKNWRILVGRTAFQPSQTGWMFATGSMMRFFGGDQFIIDAASIESPAWFAVSPVYCYARYLPGPQPSPAKGPLVFTFQHLLGTLTYTNLKIPGVRWDGYEFRNR